MKKNAIMTFEKVGSQKGRWGFLVDVVREDRKGRKSRARRVHGF